MRRQDWTSRLQATIDAAAARPFSWAEHNCVTWAGACVEAMTDEPVTPVEARKFETAAAAYRAIRDDFGGSLVAAASSLLGAPVSTLLAGRGDVCVVEVGGQQACGVVDLSGERIVCVSPKGLIFVPLSAAIAAWKV